MTLVEWVLAVVHVLVLGLTIVAVRNGVKSASTTLQDWAWKYNSYAFTFGSLVGHWFIPTKWLGFQPIVFYPWLLIPMGILLILDLVNKYVYNFPKWSRWPAIYLVMGIPCGALLWGS